MYYVYYICGYERDLSSPRAVKIFHEALKLRHCDFRQYIFFMLVLQYAHTYYYYLLLMCGFKCKFHFFLNAQKTLFFKPQNSFLQINQRGKRFNSYFTHIF